MILHLPSPTFKCHIRKSPVISAIVNSSALVFIQKYPRQIELSYTKITWTSVQLLIVLFIALLSQHDKCDVIIVEIVINSDNFDQFWLMWPSVTTDNCEQSQVLWLMQQIWAPLPCPCHKSEHFWWPPGTSFEREAISKPINVYYETFEFQVYKIHVASRGLSLTTCQSYFNWKRLFWPKWLFRPQEDVW